MQGHTATRTYVHPGTSTCSPIACVLNKPFIINILGSYDTSRFRRKVSPVVTLIGPSPFPFTTAALLPAKFAASSNRDTIHPFSVLIDGAICANSADGPHLPNRCQPEPRARRTHRYGCPIPLGPHH